LKFSESFKTILNTEILNLTPTIFALPRDSEAASALLKVADALLEVISDLVRFLFVP